MYRNRKRFLGAILEYCTSLTGLKDHNIICLLYFLRFKNHHQICIIEKEEKQGIIKRNIILAIISKTNVSLNKNMINILCTAIVNNFL